MRETVVRLNELAIRLVAPGPKCCAISASECHELHDGIASLTDERTALIAENAHLKAEVNRLTELCTSYEHVIDYRDASAVYDAMVRRKVEELFDIVLGNRTESNRP